MTEPGSPCPCGEIYELSAEVRAAYAFVTAGQPPAVVITTPAGSWYVPRIWIAAHGLKGDELPALAERYGFEPA